MVMIREIPRKNLGKANRIVQTFTNGFVVKFGCPLSPKSGGQNLLEYKTWQKVKNEPNVSNILMPVLDAAPDGSWLYMAQARTERTWDQRQRAALKRKVAALGLEVDDMHDGNLGWNANGNLVMIDYGYKHKEFGKRAQRCDGCEWGRLIQNQDLYHMEEGICCYCWKPMDVAKDRVKIIAQNRHNPEGYKIHVRCW